MEKVNGRPPKHSLHKPTGQAKVATNGKVTYLGKWKSHEALGASDRLVSALPKLSPPVPDEPGPYPAEVASHY